MPKKPWYVVVNRHVVQTNRKKGEDNPIFRVSHGRSGKPHYGNQVGIFEGILVNRPDKPLPCGATVYIETDYEPHVY